MKRFIIGLLIFSSFKTNAQKIENIYANLYTDSLKKGTYNYINVDGLLTNGNYMPLDSTDIVFSASSGKFSGNSLWIENDFTKEKISFKVSLRKDPSVCKNFDIYIKQLPNDEKLRTTDEIINEMKREVKSKKRRNLSNQTSL